MSRSKQVRNILNSLGLPEFMEGVKQADKWGESWVPESQNFRGGPMVYAAGQPRGLKPDLSSGQSSEVLGYGGSFQERKLQRNSAGEVLRDGQGQALKERGNRIYDDAGNVIGFGTVDSSGKTVAQAPSGPMMGLGYAAERLKNDYLNNGTLNVVWRFNHPSGSASSFARSVLSDTGEARGNRAMPVLSNMAPAVILGAAAGNVFIPNVINGQAGRTPGTQMVLPEREEDGTIGDRKKTESALAEVANRYLLGRTGRMLPEYSEYAADKLENGIIPESPDVYYDTRSRQWEKKTPLNLFGLFKTNPTDAISGESSFTQLGYTVPLSGAASLGGALTAAGVTGHQLKKNPAWLGERGSGKRHRRSAAALGAAMAVGSIAGKAIGGTANDVIQQAINPENYQFKQQLAAEIERRKQFINENS